MTGGPPGTRRKRPGVPCTIRLSPLLRWEAPAGHRPAPGSHAARCGAGPTFDPGHLAMSGDVPDVTTGGEHTGLWRAEARGAATCPAARATQCQEPALKAQPCRVTPLVESQKSQSSKAEQIGSGGNGGGPGQRDHGVGLAFERFACAPAGAGSLPSGRAAGTCKRHRCTGGRATPGPAAP